MMEETKPKYSGIYGIRNKENNMIYVGLSINIHNRWIEHRYRLKTQIHSNTKLQNAWNKYGEDAFEFFVIERCSEEEIYEREKYWIKYYNSCDRKFGYNLSTGGEKPSEGVIWTDERKEIASKKRNPKKVVQVDIYGNIIRIWRSASHADRTLNLCAAKIKQCCEHKSIHCGNYLWFYEEDEMLHDKEAIRKFVMNNSSYIDIPIMQYDLYGNFINKYVNFLDIESKLDVKIIHIRECCIHKYHYSHNYIWLFELDDFKLTNEYLLKCRLLSETYELEQYDFNGNYITTYNKYNLPDEFRLDTVIANCNNICKSAYGYVWKFKGDDRKIINKEYIIKNKICGKTKPLFVYDENFQLIKKYNAVKDAKNDGYVAEMIRKCCSGKIDTYKGFIWRYEEVS